MNKALFMMLAMSVALNVYLVNVEVVVRDDLDREYIEQPKTDHISIAQAAVEKSGEKSSEKTVSDCEPKIVEKIVYREAAQTAAANDIKEGALKSITKKDLEAMSAQEMGELAKRYEKEWQQKSQKFFEYELGLSPSQQNDYLALKTSMEEEISSMLGKSATGEKREGPRMMTPEEMVEMGRIHQKYVNKLKAAFGDNAYNEYINFREAYNRKIADDIVGGVYSVSF